MADPHGVLDGGGDEKEVLMSGGGVKEALGSSPPDGFAGDGGAVSLKDSDGFAGDGGVGLMNGGAVSRHGKVSSLVGLFDRNKAVQLTTRNSLLGDDNVLDFVEAQSLHVDDDGLMKSRDVVTDQPGYETQVSQVQNMISLYMKPNSLPTILQSLFDHDSSLKNKSFNLTFRKSQI